MKKEKLKALRQAIRHVDPESIEIYVLDPVTKKETFWGRYPGDKPGKVVVGSPAEAEIYTGQKDVLSLLTEEQRPDINITPAAWVRSKKWVETPKQRK